MTSLLEERYRRTLKLLPRSYREKWADDMTATFMERAYRSRPDDPEGVDISSPRWPEVASIAGLAVRLRLGAEPGYVAWGEAVRRIALIGLLAHTVFALTAVTLGIWSAEQLPGVPEPAVSFTSWWQALWSMSSLLWLPAYLAALHGHRRAARVLAVVAYAPMLAGELTRLYGEPGGNATWQFAWLAFDALPLLALIAFQSDDPPVRQRPWLLALPVGVAVLSGVVLLTLHFPDRFLLSSVVAGGTGLWCAGVTLAGIAALTPAGRASTWPLTLALLTPPVLAVHALLLVGTMGLLDPPTQEYVVPGLAGLGQCVVLLIVGTALAAASARHARTALPA
ncbi:hypothetical protein [Actinoplanes sp. NPDC049681]|uniref:hypothetical protein n=1 Tax=Actinoplanes sp. NPDC049681 TaxID=3363905 RepID=UPI00379199FF